MLTKAELLIAADAADAWPAGHAYTTMLMADTGWIP
jgi:hypothetical protein